MIEICRKGTKTQDTMMNIVESCKKLGVNLYKFIEDSINGIFKMPSIAELVKQRALKPIQYDSS